MVNSIKKGHRFEREIADLLSFYTGTRFYRTPNSGATARINELKTFSGDILTEDVRFSSIVIECKFYGKPITLAELDMRKGALGKWISQTKEEAKGRRWVLFFRWNRSDVYMCFDWFDNELYQAIKQYVDVLGVYSDVCLGKVR